MSATVHAPEPIVRRVVVIGSTAAGKSTLAAALARCLGVPFVELDAFMHEANWRPASPDDLRDRTARAVAGDGWVVAGNYYELAAREIVWPRAELIVWLDYSLPRVLCQLFRRTVRRIVLREELWNGNRETFRKQFLSRESLFLWTLQSYGPRRRVWPRRFGLPEHRHLAVAHLRDPRATRIWLEGFCATVRAGHLAAALATP